MSREQRPIEEIAPNFPARYGVDSFEAAIKAAESAESSTPEELRRRCPACGSVRLSPLNGPDMPHKPDTDYTCTNCREHVDNLRPPDAAVEADLNVALRVEDDAGLCSACGDSARVFLHDEGVGVGGHACLEHVGDLIARGIKDADSEPDPEPSRPDPFEWVSDDDLEDAPLLRRLHNADDETLTELVIRLYRPWAHRDDDPSYRDLAAVFPVSRQWIGERVRAWRDDGEHRDLVAAPRLRVSIATEEVEAE